MQRATKQLGVRKRHINRMWLSKGQMAMLGGAAILMITIVIILSTVLGGVNTSTENEEEVDIKGNGNKVTEKTLPTAFSTGTPHPLWGAH